jgi:hypothetical protein
MRCERGAGRIWLNCGPPHGHGRFWDLRVAIHCDSIGESAAPSNTVGEALRP